MTRNRKGTKPTDPTRVAPDPAVQKQITSRGPSSGRVRSPSRTRGGEPTADVGSEVPAAVREQIKWAQAKDAAEQERQVLRDAVRIARDAVSYCTRQRFLYVFEPWLSGDVSHEWVARIDRSRYAGRWVREAQIPALDALKGLQAKIGEDLGPILRAESRVADKDLRRRIAFTQACFIRLWESTDPAVEAPAMVEGYAAVLEAERSSLEQYHDYFEGVAHGLEVMARRVEAGERPLCLDSAMALARVQEARAKEDSSQVAHAGDFNWLVARGTTYKFKKGHQASVIALLYESWERSGRKDGCGLSEETLTGEVASGITGLRIARLFKGHPALGGILKSAGRGTWGLYLCGPG